MQLTRGYLQVAANIKSSHVLQVASPVRSAMRSPKFVQQRSRSSSHLRQLCSVSTAAVVEKSTEMNPGGYDQEGQERERSLVAKFRLADKDGNGVIDRSELAALLSSFEDGAEEAKEPWLTDEEVDKILSVYDENGSGTLQYSQFKNLAKDGVLLQGTVQQYSDAFSKVDSDGDGLISAQELATMFGNVDSNVDKARIEQEFKDYDISDSGKIGFHAFLRMFRRHLLDIESVIRFMHTPLPENSGGAASSLKMRPGEVREIESEEELDQLMVSDERLTILLAGFTWCRPCRALLLPYGKLAERYKDEAKFIKFYGNANENTKVLFRDRLKARATPTICFFNQQGEMTHQHSGGNKQKLEFYIRDAVDASGSTVYPEYQLTEKELEERASKANK